MKIKMGLWVVAILSLLGLNICAGNTTGSKALAPQEVYRMVMDAGFCCRAYRGKPFHDRALKGVTLPADLFFPCRRNIWVDTLKTGVLETWSKLKVSSGSGRGGDIRLHWYPGIQQCSYQDALIWCRTMNKERKADIAGWRLPTLAELFSMIGDGKSPFPREFKLPQGEILDFWTATPVQVQGTLLEGKQKSPAHYVLRLKRGSGAGEKIFFHYRFVLPGQKAYLLPVFSEKIYDCSSLLSKQTGAVSRGKPAPKPKSGKQRPARPVPVLQNTIPGFDDKPGKKVLENPAPVAPVKIPGFDDVPDLPLLTYLPLTLDSSPKYPHADRVPVLIDEAINEALALFQSGSASFKLNQNGYTAHNDPIQVARFLSVCKSKESDFEKVQILKKKILDPENIDLLITWRSRFIKEKGHYRVMPLLVSRPDLKIITSKAYIYNRKHAPDFIKRDFQTKIAGLIKTKFPKLVSGKKTAGGDVYVSYIPHDLLPENRKKTGRVLPGLLDRLTEEAVIRTVNANGLYRTPKEGSGFVRNQKIRKKLRRIVNHKTLSRREKMERVFKSIMAPNGVDFLVFLDLSQGGGKEVYILRPYVFHAEKKIMASDLRLYQEGELMCPGTNPGSFCICAPAAGDLANVLDGLIRQVLNN